MPLGRLESRARLDAVVCVRIHIKVKQEKKQGEENYSRTQPNIGAVRSAIFEHAPPPVL